MSRRFQFSLKAFLVVLTMGCLWLGWKVERARRQGDALDALARANCSAWYLDGSEMGVGVPPHEKSDHFWHDFTATPVHVILSDDVWTSGGAPLSLKPKVASWLLQTHAIREIEFRLGTQHTWPVAHSGEREREMAEVLEGMCPSAAIEQFYYRR